MNGNIDALITQARKFIKMIKLLAIVWIILFLCLATIAAGYFLLVGVIGGQYERGLRESLMLLTK